MRIALVIDVTDRFKGWMEPDYAETLAQALDHGRHDAVYAFNWGDGGKVPPALLQRLSAPPLWHRTPRTAPCFPPAMETLLAQWRRQMPKLFLMGGGRNECVRDWQQILAERGLKATVVPKGCYSMREWIGIYGPDVSGWIDSCSDRI